MDGNACSEGGFALLICANVVFDFTFSLFIIITNFLYLDFLP